MQIMDPIFVRLGKDIGAILSSSDPIEDIHLVPCDGRIIDRFMFPELFDVYCITSSQMRLPDCSQLLPGRIFFYIICK